MCVHPTKSGAQCKKNPELFLCGTHLVNLKVERLGHNSAHNFKRDGGQLYFAPALNMIVEEINDGDFHPARLLDNPGHRSVPKRHEVKCGNCTKNGVEHPYHANHVQVKACYARRYRTESA